MSILCGKKKWGGSKLYLKLLEHCRESKDFSSPRINVSQDSRRPAGSVLAELEGRNTFHLFNMCDLHHCSHHSSNLMYCVFWVHNECSERYYNICILAIFFNGTQKLFTGARNAAIFCYFTDSWIALHCTNMFYSFFLDCLFSLVSSSRFLHV